LAGRLDDRGVEVFGSYHQRDRVYADAALDANARKGAPLAFVKRGRAQSAEDGETWGEGDVMPTLNAFDVGDVRTTAAVLGGPPEDDPLLPLGLDSHRYRCCGNGVVSDVAEWLGVRLRDYFR
jgi:hypothetical protein